jgi:hypothetical protein
VDFENYNSFMDQLVDATIKHSDDVEYVKRLGLVLGSELSMKYFVSASDASITHFLKAYINVLNDVYNEKPYDVCRMENPLIFGAPDESMVHYMAGKEINAAMAEIIKSGQGNGYRQGRVSSQEDVASILRKYEEDHKGFLQYLVTPITDPKTINTDVLASAYISLYEEVVSLPESTGASFFRYLRLAPRQGKTTS